MSSGATTTLDGSTPTASSDSFESSMVLNTLTESVSGLTCITYLSLPLSAMALDFEGRSRVATDMFTVTATGALVVLLPAASKAVAVKVAVPLSS